LVALLGSRPLAGEVAERPFALLAFALVTGIAGAAFQLARSEPRPGARTEAATLGDADR